MFTRKLFFIVLVGVEVLVLATFTTAYAGSPYPPELVSPGNGATAGANPPTLCARNAGDPDGDAVQIRFESWGGGEVNHGSGWMDAGATGNVVCWTDGGLWSQGGHTWQARSRDSSGGEAASPDWNVSVPAPSSPASCTVNSLAMSPPPAQPVGTTVTISASASCTNGVSGLIFQVNGSQIGSVGGSSGSATWSTGGLAAGDYTISVQVSDSVAGYIKSGSDSYQLTSGAPPPPPPVSCWVDSFDVWPSSPQSPGATITVSGSGHCSTGVRAIRILVNGGSIGEIGSTSINQSWYTSGLGAGDYTITIQVAGVGDNSWSQAASQSMGYRLEAQVIPTPVPAVNYFSTGDIIQIGYDVFVIVGGQRRLVPNPDTLDALGIPRSWINNKGLSDFQLNQIPRGADIPDVNRDRAGFNTFKAAYFPNTVPIVPAPTATQRSQPTSQPTARPNQTAVPTVKPDPNLGPGQSPTSTPSPTQVPVSATDSQSEGVVGNSEGIQACVPPKESQQGVVSEIHAAEEWCTEHVYALREDLQKCWKKAYPDGADWNNWALGTDGKSKGCGLSVSPANSGDIRGGDVAVWERGCGGANSDHGHVALVDGRNSDGTIRVDEARWNRDHTRVPVLSCMSFIHQGNVGLTSLQPSSESQSPGFLDKVWQTISDLFKFLFGK